MNFGNPEKPEIMGQFVGCIEGMREACLALDFPVVSGNVSLYNETNGQAILPTPTIGAVGLLVDASKAVGLGFTATDETLILIGETEGHLGQSLYLREVLGREEGPPPHVDLATERKNGDLVRAVIQGGLASACHDIAGGGLLVTVTEMAMSTGIGAEITVDTQGVPVHGWLYGEDQGRYVVATSNPDAVMAMAMAAGVRAQILGRTGGDAIALSSGESMPLASLKSTNEGWLPAYMAG